MLQKQSLLLQLLIHLVEITNCIRLKLHKPQKLIKAKESRWVRPELTFRKQWSYIKDPDLQKAGVSGVLVIVPILINAFRNVNL
jgi:hypothetical protein